MTKRAFDLAIAIPLGILMLPVGLAVAVAVRWHLGRPILFRQQRPGLHGKPFVMLKFRTMANSAGPDGQALDDAARLTPFGRALRASSLDELPELWNVILGDMSLVGPRPLLMEYLPRYSPEQARRHSVRPGITGWAQIHGRNAISWDERFRLDVWYVDHRSFWLDARILIRTITTVFARRGVSAPGDATMPKFGGNHR